MHEIFVNTLIVWTEPDSSDAPSSDRIDRILWIDDQKNFVALFNVVADDALPYIIDFDFLIEAIENGSANVVKSDPYKPPFVSEENIKPSHRDRRDRAYASIQALVENPKPELFHPQARGHLVAQAASVNDSEKKTLYARLRRFWRGGQVVNALLPNYSRCGNPGQPKSSDGVKRGRPNAVEVAKGIRQGINITPDIARKLQQGYKLFYLNQHNRTWEQVLDLTLQKFFNLGYDLDQNNVLIPLLPDAEQLPTLDQFKYWATKASDPIETAKKRKGERRYNLMYRPLSGDSTYHEFCPGSQFQIDAQIGDIYLVSSRDKYRIIGRPVIYTVKDVFSRMIVGFSVGLETGWSGAALALESMLTDKVELCSRYGVAIEPWEWPCHYAGIELLADRGELLTNHARSVVRSVGMGFSYAAPYRADWKSIIERDFGLLNQELVRWLPGATYEHRERGDHDYRLDATLNLNLFRQLIIWRILKHNNDNRMGWYNRDEFMVAHHIEPYPIDLWNWGIEARGGKLKVVDQDYARFCLLRPESASISERGIYFDGLWYEAEHQEITREKVEVRLGKGRRKVEVVRHPSNKVDSIFLRWDDGKEIVTCRLSDKSKAYLGCDWYEYKDELELEKQKHIDGRTERNQSNARYQAQRDHIVNQAETPDTKGMSKAERLSSIRDNRRAERERERRNRLEQKEGDEYSSEIDLQDENDEAYIPPRSLNNMLKGNLADEASE